MELQKELAAMPAGPRIHSERFNARLATDPGLMNGSLFGMNRQPKGLAAELEVGPKIKRRFAVLQTLPSCHGADLEPGNGRHCIDPRDTQEPDHEFLSRDPQFPPKFANERRGQASPVSEGLDEMFARRQRKVPEPGYRAGTRTRRGRGRHGFQSAVRVADFMTQ